MLKTLLVSLGVILLAATAAVFAVPRLLGIHMVAPKAEPFEMQEVVNGELLTTLLDEAVDGAQVDYEYLVEHEQQLRRIAATYAAHGPSSNPDLFETNDQSLAYWINAYNVLTLLGVIDHWPIETVHDVHGLIAVSDGFGFFWAQRFRLDGERMSLHHLENNIIRGFDDARIHAAVNCASMSCPALRSEAYVADQLDEQLDEASTHFASEAPHVVVDDEAQRIQLSGIYDWYGGDFEAHAVAIGAGSTVVDWITWYANDEMREALDRATSSEYAVEFVPYDWALNATRP